MRNKLFAILLCLSFLCPVLTARAESAQHPYTVAEVESLCDGIVAYKKTASGASSVQQYIDNGLCADAGTTAEFYAITLSQSGYYDFSAYEKALLAYLERNEVYSATTREKYALALIACGSGSEYIRRVCDSDIGAQGLMSLVFGLHLLNNGYTSAAYTVDTLIGAILDCRLSEGGWAVIGSTGDVDVTAMTVQALAPYYGLYSSVTAAIDSALSLLSQRQLESGGFRSMGVENCESAAQVLTALSSLGVDQNTDARFIKNGCTVLDAMLGYRNADGTFAHADSGFSESATTQAFYAMRAYLRMRYGQGAFYLLDRRDPDALRAAQPAPTGSRQDPGPTDHAPASTTAPAEASTADASPAAPKQYATDAPTEGATFQPADAPTDPESPDEAAPAQSGSGSYKRYAILAILLAAAILCAILFLCKKRSFKHYLSVLILAAAAIAFLLLTNFESKEAYAQVGDKASVTGSVTMTIRCDTVIDEDDKPSSIPDDGVILPVTTFTLGEGETAYDILLEASKRYDIRIDNRGGDGSAYIAGIQYLYEYDYGSLSGWMYRVNGAFPDVGCQGYALSDGDVIEWLYTKEIGKDL